MGDSEEDSSSQEQPEPAEPIEPVNHPTRNDDTLLDDLREGNESGNLRKS